MIISVIAIALAFWYSDEGIEHHNNYCKICSRKIMIVYETEKTHRKQH